jgi:DNA-binding IclR family transcriptional regulator
MASISGESVGYQTRSLIRALAILDAFGPDRPTLSVKDLHELLDVPKPTVSRLASVLEQHGLLRGAGHAYQLGPKTFELGALFAQEFKLHDAGRLPIEAMARESSQTSSLALLSGRSVVYLIVARPSRPIHHVTESGSREYAHLTGLGKALLAGLPMEVVDRVVGEEPFPRQTEHTICDRAELHAELELTRKRGYALDHEEFALGLRCVAMRVELPRVGPAAISVSGPAADYTPAAIPKLLAILERTAVALEEAFSQAADFSLPIPGRTRAVVPASANGDDDGRS